jgi:hypothetical protein
MRGEDGAIGDGSARHAVDQRDGWFATVGALLAHA